MDRPEPLIARARLWQWAALAFGYPQADFLATLSDRLVRNDLADAALASDNADTLTVALARVWEAVDTLNGHGPTLPEEHTHLFARQVLVSQYETSYALSPVLKRPQAIAEIGGMYAAFGFQVSARRPNLPDHISAELEFVAALLAKEAYALDQGWYPQAKLTRQARRKFIRENLAQWLPAFVERLEQHRRLPFYPAVAALVLALLAIEQTPDDHHRG